MKQICFRAEALPNDYGAPVVKDCKDLLKIVKQIVGAFDLMVATDKAKIDDAYMPKLVKNGQGRLEGKGDQRLGDQKPDVRRGQ